MQVKIIRPTIALKHQVLPGDVLEVSQVEAIQLIGAGKAVAIKTAAAETTDAVQAEAEIADAPSAPEAPAAKRVRNKKASEPHELP